MRDSVTITWLVLVFLSLFIMGCTASPHGESTGEYIDSSTTTTKVKASLVDRLGTDGFFIKVKTYKDEVQLSGFVDTPRIKQRAEQVAIGVKGVRNVRNDIIVKTR
jgi:osmotically-inducible protein OsmY